MDTATLLSLAQSAVDAGNVRAGFEFFEVALSQSPNDDEVLEAYAEVMIHYAQDLPRAQQMLRHAIDINPNEGYVKYLNLAQLCEAKEALQCYTKAYEIADQMLTRTRKKKAKETLRETMCTMCCAVAELYLTDLCFEEDAEAQCERAVARAIELTARSVEAHQLQASLRLSQCRPAEALAALRVAVDLTHHLSEEHQPTYESKIELGRLLMQVSPDDAFPFLLEVLQYGDNNPYVWFLLGECARLRKRFVDAARLLRRARVMLVASSGDADALHEVDSAIAVLVQEMGPEAAAQIPDLDHVNPLELLQPEEGEGNDEEEYEDLDEPEWEPAEEEADA
ncbi:TPR domain protein [Strigomonas culicis]|uniref:TPR domain protein n=1 Tax=Strigomonas culicis TaxID=28005 RepID=S9USB1_9TRYP|nr:TPR domain protein [Strigomonas culicis]|eukprot:EPY31664.1 TPR domain protein [Strigomonas culicis]